MHLLTCFIHSHTCTELQRTKQKVDSVWTCIIHSKCCLMLIKFPLPVHYETLFFDELF